LIRNESFTDRLLVGLRVDDADLLKMAKAIGVGTQKAALTLKPARAPDEHETKGCAQ
jgi:hypothetical protein